MNEDILHYYERELAFIRQMGAEFAKKYPKIAGRLRVDPDRCPDPHTERLIEAFAFLGGRIHKKIDDDLPEITESLFNILYPHYINPVPSMSVVKFEPAMKSIPPGGHKIARNTPIFSKPVHGVPCRFATRYPLTLWPIEVVSAGLSDTGKRTGNAQQTIVISLKTCNDLRFNELGWERLRFFLNGPSQHVFHLYELLFNNVCHVECISVNRDGRTESTDLKPADIMPVGFDHDERLIPRDQRSFPGYLLLLEYFCFPEKFLFFDLGGLGRISNSDFHDSLEIRISLDRAAKSNLLIDKDTFCLNAVPVINLFERIAEPVRINQEKTEYRLIPDIGRINATEVFSVDRVVGSPVDAAREREYKPFYSPRRHLDEPDKCEERAFRHMKRRPSGIEDDDGTDLFLSFTDLEFMVDGSGEETVTAHVTCTNRDLPGRMPFGDPSGDFKTGMDTPVSSIKCLIKPTQTRRPSLGGALHWRLISHLSLNYLSVVEGGAEAVREILKLYDFEDSPATRQQINGIVSIHSEQIRKRIGRSFCSGVQVTITFDEDKFVGAGIFLFASVLERFMGLSVSVNSFSQLVVMTIQRKERLKKWPPRSGNRVLP